MRRFAYAPDVNVYIDATDYGFIDVSDDVISGSVTRRVNALSNASITLQNPNRKYLKKIKPMDRIVIYLTRIHQPVLVFSGYVDRAPFEQLYPGPVTITASCTLKRLMNTYWDPALPYVMQWLAQYGWIYNNQTGTMLDPTHNLYNSDFSGGLGHLLRAVMNDVGGWPIGIKGQSKNTVHVMKLPDAFLTKTKALLKHELQSIEQQQENIDRILNTLLTADGVSVSSDGTSADSISMTDSVRDSNPLPLDTAKKHWKATIYGERVYLRDNPSSRGDIVLAIASAFEAKGIPGYVGVATAMLESGLNPTAANSSGYMGLFQTQANGAGGSVNGGAHRSALETARGTIRSTGSGYTFDDSFYPSGWQISDAADWFAVALAANPINFNTASPLEIGTWVRYKAQIAIGSGNDGYEQAIADRLNAAKAEIAKAPTNITGQNRKPEGQIGDVKTSNRSFFHGGGRGQTTGGELTGYTFKIKSNPFGDDNLLFRALYDADVPSDTLSIYVPGAKGRGTPWAQNWKNQNVILESSFGGDPFSGSPTTTAGSSKPTLGGKIGLGGFQLPTSQTPSHQTAGLPGFPAVDWFQKPGTPVGAPEKGRLSRISGHPPNEPPPLGQGGPWGLSFYYIGSETGQVYFGTHLQQVAPLGSYNKGDVIGVVGDYPGSSADHIHLGINPGGPDGLSVANAPSSMSGDGSIVNSTVPMTAQGVLGSTGVHANQQNMAATASAVAFGIELGFPAVGDATEALLLTGSRALANDVPLFNWIEFICKASGRNFQSMPNGDFLAFYPDHFNWTKQTPYFRISPIETIELNIDIGDEELTTHVFTTGDTYYDGLSFLDKVASTVASVESADFKSLVDVDKHFNAYNFLKRYGARPWQEDRPELKNSFMQFMYGWMTFLDKWAKQYYCDAQFTFLPELFPGGVVDFPPPHNLKVYVEEVTHTFDRSVGFSTSASLTSPSYYGKNAMNTAMVLADGGLR